MGFSFRKSKSFGPFRLNLSKSGLGISTGVKGARIGVGPRGVTTSVGVKGVYYRTTTSATSKPDSQASPSQAGPAIALGVVITVVLAVGIVIGVTVALLLR